MRSSPRGARAASHPAPPSPPSPSCAPSSHRSPPLPTSSLADTNKDHLIDKAEFRASFNSLLALGSKEIDLLVAKFFVEGQESLNYDEFMSVIHAYADKPMRS